ncbi:unnamed protein product [Adineta steineri]|uniref:Uncharacterized protein n=1 Tax=Adineta steineri TaxID=433720 RepID=A0A815D2S3_9BILA|nr:unnamed protein product [Adineta steineri]CAF1571787.1 unnamed protein product [Adineta steineri]
MQQSRVSRNTSTSHKNFLPCKDGYDCQLQYDNATEHNTSYSHPCRWSELCRDMNRDSEHTRHFTHAPHQAILCKYGNENCTKLTNPEHRSLYRHEGLPDYLLPCRHQDQCRDRSVEHLKKYKHPSNFYENTSNLKSNTTSNNNNQFEFNQQACRYGSTCRNQSDSNHCKRFSHPTTTASSQSLNLKSTSSFHACNTSNDMENAYRIGATLALETLSQSDQQAIKNMSADSVIVVPGTYDHIDRVLNSLNIKFTTVNQNEILTYPFRNDQTVYINCSTDFPTDAARRIRQHVENGLHIITTDWALRNVLGIAFSDFVRHNGKSTGDEVVGIQVAEPNHPLVNGFLSASKHAQPQWWLEKYSHPIEIVNRDKVRVLIRSEILGQKYQSDAVLVTFDCGKGNVIHMISHFYLQRSETRDARHQMSAKQYALDIKASSAATDFVVNQGQNLNYAQIQSSSTSAQFIYNQISKRLNSKK